MLSHVITRWNEDIRQENASLLEEFRAGLGHEAVQQVNNVLTNKEDDLMTKSVKKTAKKAVKKAAKKTAKKAAKKTAKKAVKKATKAGKKPAKKTVKKPAKRAESAKAPCSGGCCCSRPPVE
jgi:hypothetical protein